jgi:uncharacterized damage-inducible protein DinB
MHVTMRTLRGVLSVCLLASLPCLASAQAAEKPAKPAVGTLQPPAQIYGKLLSGMEKEFVDLADAMPEDKYSFVPTQGNFDKVRSFGDQVKHVAEANWYFWGSATMSDDELKAKSDALMKLKTKAEIMQALKDSFAEAHKVVDGITAESAFKTTAHGTPAGMTAFGLAHMMDHYGQMVVYLRMNGIVPPASRGGGM